MMGNARRHDHFHACGQKIATTSRIVPDKYDRSCRDAKARPRPRFEIVLAQQSPGNRLRVKRTDAAVNIRIVRQGAARRNAQGHAHRPPHVISAMAMEKMTSATGMAST